MIYLLEGCDGSGKSTLAKSNRFLKHDYFHFGPYSSPSKAFQAYEELLDSLWRDMAIGRMHDIIIDRMHISEKVYGTVYHKRRMSSSRYAYLEELCGALSVQIIFCHPPLETVIHNWRNRHSDEMIKDEEQIREVYAMYDNPLFLTGLPYTMYDYTTEIV